MKYSFCKYYELNEDCAATFDFFFSRILLLLLLLTKKNKKFVSDELNARFEAMRIHQIERIDSFLHLAYFNHSPVHCALYTVRVQEPFFGPQELAQTCYIPQQIRRQVTFHSDKCVPIYYFCNFKCNRFLLGHYQLSSHNKGAKFHFM